jgi:hypothetical protein
VRKGIGGHHRPNRGYSDTWLTPPEILEALGTFDCDPACPENMPWKTAETMYTIIDNGLMQEWRGRVWLNPPYGRDIGIWLDRMAAHGNGIALIFARTETSAFHRYVWEKADAVFFFSGRLDFLTLDGDRFDGAARNGNAGAPSCLVAYGAENVKALERSKLRGKLVILQERVN